MSERHEKGSIAGKLAFPAVLGVATFALIWFNPTQLYAWLKAFHLIAVISWMAGLLYLPRLFVYHSAAEPSSSQSETFKVMEGRLYRYIMRPAMAVTWILGLYLAWAVYDFQGGWLHLKIALVVALTAFHGYLGLSARRFAEDRRERSQRFWRFMNEVPTLLMVSIVILVIVKPF